MATTTPSSSTSTAITSTTTNNIYYRNFLRFIKSPETKYTYDYKLKRSMKYLNLNPEIDHTQLIEGKDRIQIESTILDFIENFLKNERKMQYGSMYDYLNAIAFFYEANDIKINRKKISIVLAQNETDIDDSNAAVNESTRGYTREEIAKILEICNDERFKIPI